jgi:hypothetical protein
VPHVRLAHALIATSLQLTCIPHPFRDAFFSFFALSQVALAANTELVKSMTDFDTLVRGEEAFVAHLKAVRTVYAEPIQAMMQAAPRGMRSGGYLDDSSDARPMTTITFRKVFSDALSLLKVHECVLEKLHEVERGPHDPNSSGGMCLAEVAREERVYRSYVQGLPSTLRTIAECCSESATFRAFFTRSRELFVVPTPRLSTYDFA